MKRKILILDDELPLTELVCRALAQDGHEPYAANDIAEALELINRIDFDLIFSDIVLIGESGLDFLEQIKKLLIKCPIIMITGAPSVETASQSVRLGAFDYITKPFTLDTIKRVTAQALKHKELHDRYDVARKNLDAIFRTVKDAIILVDRDECVQEANAAALEFCNLTSSVMGKPLMEVSECLWRLCSGYIERTIKDREAQEQRAINFNHKGMAKTLDLSTYPLFDDKRGIYGVVVVVRDQTRLSNLERDLKERMAFHNIVGKSPAMQELYSLIEGIADIDSTVLITGESGTGKEIVVDAIHLTGKRKSRKLVKINCAAISEQLLESELFGHVKGAFTGAIADRPGRFEIADGGTIFLDEIGDMSKATQVKLLRVLQSMEFERVGSNRSIKVDVRVVAATNRNLMDMVKAGDFREDLYYRLKVIDIQLLPLRERTEDIPILVDYLLHRLSAKMGKAVPAITPEAMQMLIDYNWPGNIRELEHTLEYCLALYGHETITVQNLPQIIRLEAMDAPSPAEGVQLNRESIISALKSSGGKKAPAARLLNISRQTLYEKMRKYSIAD